MGKPAREKVVGPLGTRVKRWRVNAEGETVEYVPTVDSLVRARKKKRVTVRFKRGV